VQTASIIRAMMEAVTTSEMSVSFYEAARHNILKTVIFNITTYFPHVFKLRTVVFWLDLYLPTSLHGVTTQKTNIDVLNINADLTVVHVKHEAGAWWLVTAFVLKEHKPLEIEFSHISSHC
jgi:hypothetical protein